MWQDTLIMVGGFIFSVALLPSIFGKQKPAKSSCIITGSVLASYVIAFVTLDLWRSATATGLTSLCWFILFFQSRKEVV